MDCDILLRSIGYKSKPIEGLIFDENNNIVPNSNGCVISAVVYYSIEILILIKEHDDMVEVGLYVTGWLKTGPVGVVDTTLKDSLVKFSTNTF